MQIPASGWIAFLLGFAFAALTPQPGHPHGPAQWIQDGHLRSLNNELCCGESDCGWISERDVTPTDNGFEVHGLVHVVAPAGAFVYRVDELVPYSEGQPSPTGDYWRCAWGGKEAQKYQSNIAEYMAHADRKCFFFPPPGS